MKNPTVSQPLVELKKALEERYLYREKLFSGRISFERLPIEGASGPNAIVYEVFPGAPFLVGVAQAAPFGQIAKEEVFRYALQSETIGTIVCYTSESENIEVFKRSFRERKFEIASSLEYYYEGSAGGDPRLFEDSGGYGHRGSLEVDLIPVTNKLENIFFEVHSSMRDIDGLHADAALEELCKLLYLKQYIEEQANNLPIRTVVSKSFGTVEEYSACLRYFYKSAVNYDLRVFRLKIPEYKRSRGVFEESIFLSSAALVKSFQLIEGFTLSKSAADVKGRAFQKVLSKSMRSGMGQYFTPAQVCDFMVDVVEPKSSDLILDPFCGSGHFLTQSLSFVRKSIGREDKEYHEFAFGKLHGIEKSDRMTRIAMTDMRLNGDGHSNIRCTDALLDFRNYPDIEPESFDIVLTNPPFGSILGAEAFSALASFKLAAGRKRVPLEVVGLERAVEFLGPGGRLAIVLPESVFTAKSSAYVRDWLCSKLSIRIIVDLPHETFSPFGANVRSGIIFARKLLAGEQPDQSRKVCMVRLDSLGYDAAGRSNGRSDIVDATKLARKFLEKEGW